MTIEETPMTIKDAARVSGTVVKLFYRPG